MAHIFKNGTLYGTTIGSEISYSGSSSGLKSSNVQAAIDEIIASKGIANGIASLDTNGLLNASQIPAYAMNNVFHTTEKTLAAFIANDSQVNSVKKGDTVILVNASGYKELYILSSTSPKNIDDYVEFRQENTPWNMVTGTPTTLAGYGITDSLTMNQFESLAITSMSISGKTITYKKGDGTEATITTQDKNVQQTPSTTNAEYPILAGTDSTNGTKETVFASGVTVNPSTGIITATLKGSATSASTLLNFLPTRPTSANITATGSGGLVTFKATSAMTTAKPPQDASIIHTYWDTTAGWDAQLAIANNTPRVYFRSQNPDTWSDWITILDSTNFNSYSPKLDGTGATGTWNISTKGTANSAKTDENGQNIASTYIKGFDITGTTITYTKGDGTTATETTQDENVKQSASVNNAEYPILASTSTDAGTRGVSFTPKVTINPSTGVLSASKFVGSIEGTSDKATSDANGQNIASTYIKGFSVVGTTVTYTKGDGSTGTFTTQDTTYDVATESANGLMSANDKIKLDGVDANANNYVHPTITCSRSFPTVQPVSGGTFAAINAIATDSTGHVSFVSRGTVTMPANSITASALQNARNIGITGGATGTPTAFDGTGDINIPVTSLDATKLNGVIPLECLPASAIERLVRVANTAARLALTISAVQNGDTVEEIDTGKMYIVIDDTKLTSEDGYQIYNAGNAATAKADANGQNIASTYIKGFSVAGTTITYTKGDGTTATIATQDTTYNSGTGITISGSTINHSNSIIAGATQGTSGTLSHGSSFTVPYVSYDAQGHITGSGTRTLTLPNSDNTDTLVNQTASSANANYPLLASTSTANGAREAVFASGITVNPATGVITATGLIVNSLDATKLTGAIPAACMSANVQAVVVSSTAPTNTGQLWVDTGNNNIPKFYSGPTGWTPLPSIWT